MARDPTMPSPDVPDVAEPGESLWAMIVPPSIWAVHFLACYVLSAIFCAKAGASADLTTIRLWVTGLTILALGGIAASGITAVRRGNFLAGKAAPHSADTIRDRRRFLAYATLLLSGLSFVATLYVALPALFVATCR